MFPEAVSSQWMSETFMPMFLGVFFVLCFCDICDSGLLGGTVPIAGCDGRLHDTGMGFGKRGTGGLTVKVLGVYKQTEENGI